MIDQPPDHDTGGPRASERVLGAPFMLKLTSWSLVFKIMTPSLDAGHGPRGTPQPHAPEPETRTRDTI